MASSSSDSSTKGSRKSYLQALTSGSSKKSVESYNMETYDFLLSQDPSDLSASKFIIHLVYHYQLGYNSIILIIDINKLKSFFILQRIKLKTAEILEQ